MRFSPKPGRRSFQSRSSSLADLHIALGAHGVGKIGITGCAAAIANAVFNATGVRVRSLPITLDKVLAG